MTTIEFQNLLNSFFQVENGHIKVKDLTISDDIIRINVNENMNNLAGFQIYRGESKPPVNIIWEEESETLNFTVGADLATVKWNTPKKIVKYVTDDYFIKDEDIIIVKEPNKTVFLPFKSEKSIKIKMLCKTCKLMDLNFEIVENLIDNKTYEFLLVDGKWVDIY